MDEYDFLPWLTRFGTTTTLHDLLQKFNEPEYQALRTNWNRFRQHVPHTIYNGVIFEWVESRLIVEEDKVSFCLDLANAIGSPSFLHHLLSPSSPSNSAVPPFGLGFLLLKFQEESKSFELLQTLLGKLLPAIRDDKDERVEYLYRDWLRWKALKHPPKAIAIMEVRTNHNDVGNPKRTQPFSESDANPNLEPLLKRNRTNPSSSFPTSRSGLYQWFGSTTSRFKPADKKNKNRRENGPSYNLQAVPEEPSGWICVDPTSTSSYIQLKDLSKEKSFQVGPTPLPEIPFLSPIHLSSINLALDRANTSNSSIVTPKSHEFELDNVSQSSSNPLPSFPLSQHRHTTSGSSLHASSYTVGDDPHDGATSSSSSRKDSRDAAEVAALLVPEKDSFSSFDYLYNSSSLSPSSTITDVQPF